MQSEQLIKRLNSKHAIIRKVVLALLKKTEKHEKKFGLNNSERYNFNIRTDYSFSPHTPTMAAFMAYKSGLSVAGVCDFGTISATNEFLSSCKTLEVSGICGFDVSLHSPVLGNCSGAFYGINRSNASIFEPLLVNYRAICKERSVNLAEKINERFAKYDIFIDYEKEVYALTRAKKGGAITLKHVFRAVAEKIIEKIGKGKTIADFLRSELMFDIEEDEYNLLRDSQNPYYIYDLIAILRKYFREIDEQSVIFPSVKIFTSAAADMGVIAAYEYTCKHRWLELETESQKVLKEFDILLDKVKAEGFNAVCLSVREYSKQGLVLFVEELRKKGLLVILNEKNEYPRSSFGIDCPSAALDYVQTCALVLAGNASSIAECQSDGIFSDKTIIKCPSFEERLGLFASIGRKRK